MCVIVLLERAYSCCASSDLQFGRKGGFPAVHTPDHVLVQAGRVALRLRL